MSAELQARRLEYGRALAEFLECLARDVEFHPNFADGCAVQKVLAALQQSVTTRQWTSIAEMQA